MTNEFLEDIEIIAPKKKRITLCGENIEVSFVPAKISIEAARIQEALEKHKISEYDALMGIINNTLLLCKSNPVINADWLMENTSFDMQIEFIAAASGKPNSTDASGNSTGNNNVKN